VVTATVDIVQFYCVIVEFIVVTATVSMVQCYCVVCVVYCCFSNIRSSAMILCCLWSLLWLQHQMI